MGPRQWQLGLPAAMRKLGSCLAGERARPPEDVGGVSGYELILEDKSLITEMSCSKLRFTYKNENYSAEGELVLPDDETVEFVLYKGSVKNENSDEALTIVGIENIIESLHGDFNSKGRKLTVED